MLSHIEFLVEEPSAESALDNLLPKILPAGVTFQVHPYEGKSNLLKKLPGRLKGYKNWLPSGWKIVVLIDEDRQDCGAIKRQLEDAARQAGLSTKSEAPGNFQVLNRIAIEELEAWFFGDIQALSTAYPGVPISLSAKAAYRDPDAIKGGTWEKLERVLQKAGYFSTGLRKIEAATEISRHMIPDDNRSKSFQTLLSGIKAMFH
ncbi:MAG: hypothetical protein FD189_123 [Elusimicrobia bacterium]|nr:MAG: hypothetical protein FD154_275 [Elusimicrobiota bacterium]KAF0158131.1 MAG: hypothetical protein FD189_123 [Elusimicrobiota bacterium]